MSLLAAEQATSRRVVADMFINLGRRNQRLVNRLLKGLTVLEQHHGRLIGYRGDGHLQTRHRLYFGRAHLLEELLEFAFRLGCGLRQGHGHDHVCVELTDDLALIRDVIMQIGHSRIPVYENNPESIIGMVLAKTDLGIGRRYADELVADSELRIGIFDQGMVSMQVLAF